MGKAVTLVKRLRQLARLLSKAKTNSDADFTRTCIEAADRIKELERELAVETAGRKLFCGLAIELGELSSQLLSQEPDK